MNTLSEKVCSVCYTDSTLLSRSELYSALVQLPEWAVASIAGVNQLSRTFPFESFAQALRFTQLVGELAEENHHHPALLTEWGKVTVSWWTHRIHGLHENDVIMAAKTDQLFNTRFAGAAA